MPVNYSFVISFLYCTSQRRKKASGVIFLLANYMQNSFNASASGVEFVRSNFVFYLIYSAVALNLLRV